jgi:hypothetical protein
MKMKRVLQNNKYSATPLWHIKEIKNKKAIIKEIKNAKVGKMQISSKGLDNF